MTSFDWEIDEPGPVAPCMIVLDCSASMAARIADLNGALARFIYEMQLDHIMRSRVALMIVGFGTDVRVVVPPTSVRNVHMIPRLTAGGPSPLGHAVELAVDTLDDLRRYVRSRDMQNYRPIMFVFSDGSPTDDWRRGAERVRALARSGGLSVVCVGVGEDADFEVLRAMSPEPLKLK
jgi:uncharacterized protein YegL